MAANAEQTLLHKPAELKQKAAWLPGTLAVTVQRLTFTGQASNAAQKLVDISGAQVQSLAH